MNINYQIGSYTSVIVTPWRWQWGAKNEVFVCVMYIASQSAFAGKYIDLTNVTKVYSSNKKPGNKDQFHADKPTHIADRLGRVHGLLCNSLYSSDQITRWLSSLTPHIAAVNTAWQLLCSLQNDRSIIPLFKNISLCWVYIWSSSHCGHSWNPWCVRSCFPLTSFPLCSHTSTQQVIR
jgi:hypothetical protein